MNDKVNISANILAEATELTERMNAAITGEDDTYKVITAYIIGAVGTALTTIREDHSRDEAREALISTVRSIWNVVASAKDLVDAEDDDPNRADKYK